MPIRFAGLTSSIEVAPNDAKDLKNTIDTYGGEKIIIVPEGDYTPPDTITIDGGNPAAWEEKPVYIKGIGGQNCILRPPTGKPIFTLINRPTVRIEGFKVIIPNNGKQVIYALDSGTSEIGMLLSRLKDLIVQCGTGTEFPFEFQNAEMSDFVNINIETYGKGGFLFDSTSTTYSRGNCRSWGENRVWVKAANGIGWHYKGNATKDIEMMQMFGRNTVKGDPSLAGTIGLKLEHASNNFTQGIRSEYLAKMVDIVSTSFNNLIKGSNLWSNIRDGGYFFDIESTCKRNTIKEHFLEVPSAVTANIRDLNTDANSPNEISDLRINNQNVLALTLDEHTRTKGWYGSSLPSNWRTRNSGTATILNGQTNVIVNHGLHHAPNCPLVTGRNADTVSLRVGTITDTQFTITAPAAVGGDRIISWYAEIYPM